MDISSIYNSGCLTIAVHGRVDSSTAPTFQKKVDAEIDRYVIEKGVDIANLVIDARDMEFISSLGLRVFLQLRRRFKGMRVTECNEDVFNVFKMTGFTHMIIVEKALPKVTLSGLEPIPGYSDLYGLTCDTMLKVFPEGTTQEDVDHVVTFTRKAFIHDIPTPMTFEKKMLEDRLALVYERITPAKPDASSLAEVLRELHKHTVDASDVIPSAVTRIKERIQRLKPYFGDENTIMLKQIVEALPESACMLHGNLTLDKVATCTGQPMIMDLGELCYGNALIDLAHLYFTLTEDRRTQFFDDFLHSYYDLASEDTIERNRQNIKTLSIVFEYTDLIMHGTPSREEMGNIRIDFEERVAAHWNEIRSSLRFKIDFNEEVNRLVRMRFYTDCDVNIDWMAQRLLTNRHYVSDYFSKVLHTTFTDFINTLRLDYAVELLRAGKIPMSQIAYTIGFNNDHTFRRLFKERFGTTPVKYKG